MTPRHDIAAHTDDEPAIVGGMVGKRHRLSTRLWHWTNGLTLLVMVMSGLMVMMIDRVWRLVVIMVMVMIRLVRVSCQSMLHGVRLADDDEHRFDHQAQDQQHQQAGAKDTWESGDLSEHGSRVIQQLGQAQPRHATAPTSFTRPGTVFGHESPAGSIHSPPGRVA